MCQHDSGRLHVLFEPAVDLEPIIRARLAVLIGAGLDGRLEFRHGEAPVVEIAGQEPHATGARMHVAVDEPRHQHAARQIDASRLAAHERARPGVVADIDDLPGPHSERLGHRVGAIHRVDVAVLEERIRRALRLCRQRPLRLPRHHAIGHVVQADEIRRPDLHRLDVERTAGA